MTIFYQFGISGQFCFCDKVIHGETPLHEFLSIFEIKEKFFKHIPVSPYKIIVRNVDNIKFQICEKVGVRHNELSSEDLDIFLESWNKNIQQDVEIIETIDFDIDEILDIDVENVEFTEQETLENGFFKTPVKMENLISSLKFQQFENERLFFPDLNVGKFFADKKVLKFLGIKYFISVEDIFKIFKNPECDSDEICKYSWNVNINNRSVITQCDYKICSFFHLKEECIFPLAGQDRVIIPISALREGYRKFYSGRNRKNWSPTLCTHDTTCRHLKNLKICKNSFGMKFHSNLFLEKPCMIARLCCTNQ